MSRYEGKPESKLVIIPEYFFGKGSYEDWINQFESIVEIDQWNEEQKLRFV